MEENYPNDLIRMDKRVPRDQAGPTDFFLHHSDKQGGQGAFYFLGE